MNTSITKPISKDIISSSSTEKKLVEILNLAFKQYKSFDEKIQGISSSPKKLSPKKSKLEEFGIIDFNFSLNENEIDGENIQNIDRLSKVKEREFRQFITALQVLKQLQAPPLQVNIKTNEASFVQNQQNNIQN